MGMMEAVVRLVSDPHPVQFMQVVIAMTQGPAAALSESIVCTI
jgi:hypothetical protein